MADAWWHYKCTIAVKTWQPHGWVKCMILQISAAVVTKPQLNGHSQRTCSLINDCPKVVSSRGRNELIPCLYSTQSPEPWLYLYRLTILFFVRTLLRPIW